MFIRLKFISDNFFDHYGYHIGNTDYLKL